jgi:hypothetical protein
MDRIIERIRKLIRLANDPAASDGERDNAMRMAQATLAKYNLSASALDTPTDRGRTDSPFYGRPWARTVAKACAELYFCQYFYMASRNLGRDEAFHCFVGTEANRVTAEEMAKYLINSILRESKSCGSTKDRNSFGFGAASRIWTRAVELKAKPPEEAYSGSTALILASHYGQEKAKNESWLAEQGVHLRSKSAKTRQMDEGYRKGYDYGDKVSLNRQVNEKAQGILPG